MRRGLGFPLVRDVRQWVRFSSVPKLPKGSSPIEGRDYVFPQFLRPRHLFLRPLAALVVIEVGPVHLLMLTTAVVEPTAARAAHRRGIPVGFKGRQRLSVVQKSGTRRDEAGLTRRRCIRGHFASPETEVRPRRFHPRTRASSVSGACPQPSRRRGTN